MASKSQTGEFTSSALFQVTESGANTLTWEKLETGLSVYDKIGWVVQRLEFYPSNGLAGLMNASADAQTAALTMTNGLSSLDVANPAVICVNQFFRWDVGVAASGSVQSVPIVYDYSGMAGGGLLILPNPLYLGLQGSGLTAASSLTLKMYFRAIDLTDQDYFNLVQARQLLIST